MHKIEGLPAHILLNHFVVVLVPLTAALLILCAIWPAARQRLIWLVVALAAITAVVTPLTINAGEWLYDWLSDHQPDYLSPQLDTHAERGEHMVYFAVALLIAAALLAALHVQQGRGHQVQVVVQGLVAVLVIAVAVASLVQVHRVGYSGACAVWDATGPCSSG